MGSFPLGWHCSQVLRMDICTYNTYIYIYAYFYLLYFFVLKATPISSVLSQYLILIVSPSAILTCFFPSEKPDSPVLNIFTYLINPSYLTNSNCHHSLSPALLTLIGLWHPALGYSSTSPRCFPFTAGLLHPELRSSPAEMPLALQWESAIPCGLPSLFPY